MFEQFKEGRTLQLKENMIIEGLPEICIINVFLASLNELANELEKIEQAFGRKNKSLRKKGFLVDLLIWEDGKYIGKSIRSQDDYNLKIAQCNLFTMLFFSKVGKYSSEKFELARSLFDKGATPRVRIFQKKKDLPNNINKMDSDSRYDFLEGLNNLQHFPVFI